MRFTGVILLFFMTIWVFEPRAQADDFSEEQRLQGFAEHKRQNSGADREREAKASEIKAEREAWEAERLRALDEFKASKSKQAQTINEASPQYEEDLKEKKKAAAELEKYRQDFVTERDQKRRQKRQNITLSEMEELGLVPEPERVDFSKRAMYGGKTSFGGKVDFAGTPSVGRGGGMPPPPPPPEFYESEAPPPPPPPIAPLPEPMFEDAIQPPIFDDPEF